MKKIFSILSSLMIAFGWLTMLPAPVAHAATCSWTGATSGDWSDASNWSSCGGGVPNTGDDVYINSGGFLNALNNDIGPITLGSLIIGASNVNLTNNSISIVALDITGNDNFIVSPIEMIGSGSSMTVSGTGNTITNPINLDIIGADFNITTNQDFNAPAFTGTTDNFRKYGNATLNMTSGSSFITDLGGVNVHAGTLTCASSDCAGDSSNPLGQFSGGKILFTGDATLDNDVILNYMNGAKTVGLEISNGVGVIVTGTVYIYGPAQIQLGNGSDFQTTGTVNMNLPLEVIGNSADTSQYLVSSSGLTNSGELSCTNATCWLDTASATYNGVIRGHSGSVIRVGNSDALGSTAGNTIIENGASLQTLNGSDFTIPENISLEGTGVGGSGALRNEDVMGTRTFSGTITLAGDSLIFNRSMDMDFDARLVFSGVITGAGDLTLSGSGIGDYTHLEGASANTYAGTTMVNDTEVVLDKDPGAIAIPGDLQINASTWSALVHDNGGEQIADTSAVTLSEVGGFDAGWQVMGTETVGSVAGAGGIYIDNGMTLNTGGNNSSTTYSGEITSSPATTGTLNKVGTGTMTLSGDQASGSLPTITVNGGTLVVNGAWSESPISVASNATLKGTGSAGATSVASGGTINAGNSPGCITVASLTLMSGSNFDQEIAGGTACTEYDRTTVTGTADLGSATLNVQPSYTPTPGTIFTIIQAGSVVNTFNGLPDGATFTANGIQFRINYTNTQVNLTVLGGTLVPTGQNHNNVIWYALFTMIIGAVGVGFGLRRKKLSV